MANKKMGLFERILKMYVMYQLHDVRTPMPHLFGPPGVGKSSIVQQVADTLGVKLHIVNVSRLSPLEIEGVQMPVDMDTQHRKLDLLISTLWSKLEEGDIILFDEFLRGFPEVYNGLLDIFTSREVAGHKLPQVFIIGASNSTVSYDKALEDRLLHLPVPDIRKSKADKTAAVERFVREAGLLPSAAKCYDMDMLVQEVVSPMYEVLDILQGKGNSAAAAAVKGSSFRNLLGQIQLREVHTPELQALIRTNNDQALRNDTPQYMIMLEEDAAAATPATIARLVELRDSGKLSGPPLANVQAALQMLAAHQAITEGDAP